MKRSYVFWFLLTLAYTSKSFGSETEMDDEALQTGPNLVLPIIIEQPASQTSAQATQGLSIEETSKIIEPKDQSIAVTQADELEPNQDQNNKDKEEDKKEEKETQSLATHLELLDTSIPPKTSTRLAWRPGHALEGLASQAPVLVVHGKFPGPKLCITAAVHGDELNGIEVVRRLVYNIDVKKLKGTIIGVPIVNIQGFHRNSRYLTDRRDLNRFFPGTPYGSLASRIAYSFFQQVIRHCSILVDVHTGSFYRTNLPQLRGDLQQPKIVEVTQGFGSVVVIHSEGANGTLRRAAVNAGIPAVTLELGGPMILDESAVDHGVKGLMNLLHHLTMYPNQNFWGSPKPTYFYSRWVRVDNGGIFFSRVELGESIKIKQVLGTITNPITNERFLLKAPLAGQVIGLANDQVVYPGFAAVHIASEAPKVPLSTADQAFQNQQSKEPRSED